MAPAPRPGILDIALYKGGRDSLPNVREPRKLASNESPFGASPRAKEALRSVQSGLHRYPDGGHTALREALAAMHGLDPARIVCGAGSDELIQALARAYAGPGDEVLVGQYGFLMYRINALGAGATPLTWAEPGMIAEVDAICALLSPRTRIVFLANPNNPTGSYMSADALTRLHAALPETVLLVIDAAYAEYVKRNDYSSGLELVHDAPNVVTTRTFSKIYGLAALRLGWAYCPADVAGVLNRIRTPFNVSVPALSAGLATLEDRAFIERARVHNDAWLARLPAALTRLGLEPLPSVGNFVLVRFPADAARDATAAEAHLHRRGIIPRAMAPYGLPDCLRISIGLDDDNEAVLAALGELMGT